MLNMNSFNSDKNSTLKRLTQLYKFGISALFNMYVSSSPSDPNQALIQVSQASWFFIKDYYEDDDTMNSYKQYIKRIATLMNSTSDNLDAEIERMVNLEKTLAKVCSFLPY